MKASLSIIIRATILSCLWRHVIAGPFNPRGHATVSKAPRHNKDVKSEAPGVVAPAGAAGLAGVVTGLVISSPKFQSLLSKLPSRKPHHPRPRVRETTSSYGTPPNASRVHERQRKQKALAPQRPVLSRLVPATVVALGAGLLFHEEFREGAIETVSIARTEILLPAVEWIRTVLLPGLWSVIVTLARVFGDVSLVILETLIGLSGIAMKLIVGAGFIAFLVSAVVLAVIAAPVLEEILVDAREDVRRSYKSYRRRRLLEEGRLF